MLKLKEMEKKLSMKKVLLTLLGILLVIGVLAGAGFAGYRIGYQQGALTTTDGNPAPFTRGFQLGPQDMPMHNFGRDFDRGFNRGFGPGGFRMMDRGMGFGFFPPFMFLAGIVFWGLIIWFTYWLFTRSGWQITRRSVESSKSVEAAKVEVSELEKKSD